jgi:hypothetical protein
MSLDPATIKRIIRIANIIQRAVREYLRDDKRASYPLTGDVWIEIKSKRVAKRLEGFKFGEYTTKDGSLTLRRIDEKRVRVTAHAFQRVSKLWNGPDVLKNNELASMFASLFHDLMWGHREELAEVLGITPKGVKRVANDVFILAWRAIDPSLKGRVKSYFAFQALSAATPWYGEKKQSHASENAIVALAFAAVALSGCSGCYSIPDGEATEVGGVDVVEQIMHDYGDGLGPDPVTMEESE